ncbi:MAG: hypothetical protein SP1CHLAM9_03380 [Chlamydiia bacterium]|nr:hypothetical protein [Chlamydiia bacterium]MCH9624108.1 hypothetical protein [Chlamydiia bacterium]
MENGRGEIRTHVNRRLRDLQSLAIGHYATLPLKIESILRKFCWRRDSNPQPSDYKSGTLPVELRQQNGNDNSINNQKLGQSFSSITHFFYSQSHLLF